MIGSTVALTQAGQSTVPNGVPAATLYIPLQFWLKSDHKSDLKIASEMLNILRHYQTAGNSLIGQSATNFYRKLVQRLNDNGFFIELKI